MPGLHFVPWHRGSGCLGAAAPVTGAAADEYNLNVVDCDASVTVPRLVLKWGSGGYPQPPEANVKDNGFPWPPPGLLGFFFFRLQLHARPRGRRQRAPLENCYPALYAWEGHASKPSGENSCNRKPRGGDEDNLDKASLYAIRLWLLQEQKTTEGYTATAVAHSYAVSFHFEGSRAFRSLSFSLAHTPHSLSLSLSLSLSPLVARWRGAVRDTRPQAVSAVTSDCHAPAAVRYHMDASDTLCRAVVIPKGRLDPCEEARRMVRV